MPEKKIEISIIVPVFNESESLPELLRRTAGAMEKLNQPWEIVLIDDGSTDNSLNVLKKLQKDYKQIKILELRRNYGKAAALQAGFDHCKGEIIITMDGDLQNDPADIPAMLNAMKKEQADVVSGWRYKRKDKKLTVNWPSKVGNAVISYVTGLKLHDNGCALKIYTKEALQDVRVYGGQMRFIPVLAWQAGAKVIEVKVNHHPRKYGQSNYGLDKAFRVILDLITIKFFLKFMHRPVHAFGQAGLLCLVPGVVMASYLVVLKLFGESIGTRPLLMLCVLLILIGVQLIGMGVLAEVMMRVYHEPAGRKQYHLKK